MFFDEAGHNFQTSGLLLEFPSCSIRLWARVGGVVQDGGAHKAIWHSRGDGASMCCMRCLNLCTVASRVCDEDGTGLLVCNVIKASELVPSTSANVRNRARYLEAQSTTVTGPDFVELVEMREKLPLGGDTSIKNNLRPGIRRGEGGDS